MKRKKITPKAGEILMAVHHTALDRVKETLAPAGYAITPVSTFGQTIQLIVKKTA